MAARYKSRKPAPTFSNHLNDLKCVLLFFPLKHYKPLQEFQMALKITNASSPARRGWWGQLLAESLVSAITQWRSAPSEGWRAQPSLLGLQLGGGKVSRMKEWECKQTAHSTGSRWQEKGFPGKGRENEGLQRKAKRKPHEVLFQKEHWGQTCLAGSKGLCCQQQEMLPSWAAQPILL